MDKHKNGKHLRVKAIHNNVEFNLCVVKGSSPDHLPSNKLESDKIHFGLARSKKEFDENLNEMLNEVSNGVEATILCPTDIVYEYGFTRVKEYESKM